MADKHNNDLKKRKKSGAIQVSIHKISLIGTKSDFPPNLDYSDVQHYTYAVEVDITCKQETSMVSVTVLYKFFYDNASIFEMDVQTNYLLKNYSDVVENKRVQDEVFLYYMVGNCLNHARGVQSTLIGSTPISGFYIPLIKKEAITSRITYSS